MKFRLAEAREKLAELSDLFMSDAKISGVALTGSVARNERLVRDIDLVLFHSGKLKDGVYHSVGSLDRSSSFGRHLGDQELARRIFQLLGKMPASFIFAHEKILTDCRHLQSKILPEGKTEEREFFPIVLCQIPLFLIQPDLARRGLRTYVRNLLAGRNLSAKRNLLRIRHSCGNPACRPSFSWKKVQERLRRRKDAAARRRLDAQEKEHRRMISKGYVRVSSYG